MRSKIFASTALAVVLSMGLAAPTAAEEGYRTPPAEITDIVTRAPAPRVSLSPDKSTMLLMEREAQREADGGVYVPGERPPHY